MAEFFARLVPKKSTQPGEVPNPDLDLIEGEIAINTADGKIWTKHSDGTLVPLGGEGGGEGGSVGEVLRRTAQFWGNSKKTTDTPAEVVGPGAWCIRTDLQGITVSEFSADGTRFDGNAYSSGSQITLTVVGQEHVFTLAADPTQVVDQLFTFEFTEDTTSLNNLLNGTDLVAIGLVTTDAEDGDILVWSDACQCWLAEPQSAIQAVQSVNGQTGDVTLGVLDLDDVDLNKTDPGLNPTHTGTWDNRQLPDNWPNTQGEWTTLTGNGNIGNGSEPMSILMLDDLDKDGNSFATLWAEIDATPADYSLRYTDTDGTKGPFQILGLSQQAEGRAAIYWDVNDYPGDSPAGDLYVEFLQVTSEGLDIPPAEGDVLTYHASSQTWRPGTVSLKVMELADVTGSPVNGGEFRNGQTPGTWTTLLDAHSDPPGYEYPNSQGEWRAYYAPLADPADGQGIMQLATLSGDDVDCTPWHDLPLLDNGRTLKFSLTVRGEVIGPIDVMSINDATDNANNGIWWRWDIAQFNPADYEWGVTLGDPARAPNNVPEDCTVAFGYEWIPNTSQEASDGQVLQYNAATETWQAVDAELTDSGISRIQDASDFSLNKAANTIIFSNKVSNYTVVAAAGDWSADSWGGGGGGFLVNWLSVANGGGDLATQAELIQPGDTVTMKWPDESTSTETVATTYAVGSIKGFVINDPHTSNWSGHSNGTELWVTSNRFTGSADIPLAEGNHLEWDASDEAFKPTQLATVAKTGSYNDLSDLPTIPPEVEPGIDRIQDASDFQLHKEAIPSFRFTTFKGATTNHQNCAPPVVGADGEFGMNSYAGEALLLADIDSDGQDFQAAFSALSGGSTITNNLPAWFSWDDGNSWAEIVSSEVRDFCDRLQFHAGSSTFADAGGFTKTSDGTGSTGPSTVLVRFSAPEDQADIPLAEGDHLQWDAAVGAFMPVQLEPGFSGDYGDLTNTPDLSLKADLVDGKVPADQLPAIAVSEYLGTVADEAAMLALTGQSGDWCVRVDTDSAWILSADDASVLANWIELGGGGAGGVVSVNEKTGAVSLGIQDMNDYDLRTYTPPMQRWDDKVAMDCNSVPGITGPGQFLGPGTCWSNWYFNLGPTDADGNPFGADAWPSTLKAGDTVYLLTDLEADWVPYQLKNDPTWTSGRGWDLDPDSNGVSLTGGFSWIQASPAPGPAHVDIPMEFGDVLVWDDDPVHGAAFRPQQLNFSELPGTPSEFPPEAHTHAIQDASDVDLGSNPGATWDLIPTADAEAAMPAGKGYTGTTGIRVSPIDSNGVDQKADLRGWLASASPSSVTVRIDGVVDSSYSVTILDEMDDSGAYSPRLRFDATLSALDEHVGKTLSIDEFDQYLLSLTTLIDGDVLRWSDADQMFKRAQLIDQGIERIQDASDFDLSQKTVATYSWDYQGVVGSSSPTAGNCQKLSGYYTGRAIYFSTTDKFGHNIHDKTLSMTSADVITASINGVEVWSGSGNTWNDTANSETRFQILFADPNGVTGAIAADDVLTLEVAAWNVPEDIPLAEGDHLEWDATDEAFKPTQLATVAKTGSYDDLQNLPALAPENAITKIVDAEDFKFHLQYPEGDVIPYYWLYETQANVYRQDGQAGRSTDSPYYMQMPLAAYDILDVIVDLTTWWTERPANGEKFWFKVEGDADWQVFTKTAETNWGTNGGTYTQLVGLQGTRDSDGETLYNLMSQQAVDTKLYLSWSEPSDAPPTEVPLVQGEVISWDAAQAAFTPQQLNLPASYVTSLDDLDDVDTSTTAPTDKQVLAWDAAQLRWKPMSDPAAPVQSVQGKTGEVRLNIQEMDDFALNRQPAPAARYVRNANVSTGAPEAGTWSVPNTWTIAFALVDADGQDNTAAITAFATAIGTNGSAPLWTRADGADAWTQSNCQQSYLDGVHIRLHRVAVSGSGPEPDYPYYVSFVEPGDDLPIQLANSDLLLWDDDAAKFRPTPFSWNNLLDKPYITTGGVDSVNGQTGVVSLGINDLDDVASGYVPDNAKQWGTLAAGSDNNRAPSAAGQWGYFEGGETNRQLRLNVTDQDANDWGDVMQDMGDSGLLYVSQDNVSFRALPYRAKAHNTTNGYWSFFVDPYVPPKAAGPLWVSLEPPESPQFQPWMQGDHLEFTGTLWTGVQLHPIAKSGSYNDLDDAPALHTAGRATETLSFPQLGPGQTGEGNLVETGRGGTFLTVHATEPCWIRFYTDPGSRSADAGRSQTVNPDRGSGVLLEVIADGSTTYKITPAVGYFNLEEPTQGRLAVAVTNTDGGATLDINVTVSVLVVEP